MTTTITLDEKDIRDIVAAHFKVDKSQVFIVVKGEYDGHYPFERKFYRASCTIICREENNNGNN